MRVPLSLLLLVACLVVCILGLSRSAVDAGSDRPLDLPAGGASRYLDDDPGYDTILMHGTEVEGDVFVFIVYYVHSEGYDLLREEMKKAIGQLSSSVRMNVLAMTRDGATSWAKKLTYATRKNRRLATEWIDRVPSLPSRLRLDEVTLLAQSFIPARTPNRRQPVLIASANLAPSDVCPGRTMRFQASVHVFSTEEPFWEDFADLSEGTFSHVARR